MNLDEIIKEIFIQSAYAESITGYKPERVILGIDVFRKVIKLSYFVKTLEYLEPDIIIDCFYVTIDYRNKELIKVVPEIKIKQK